MPPAASVGVDRAPAEPAHGRPATEVGPPGNEWWNQLCEFPFGDHQGRQGGASLPMVGSFVKLALFALGLVLIEPLVPGTGLLAAETPPPPTPSDAGTAAIHSELIGAPVYAADGVLVGEVADISYDEDDQPRRVRMTSSTSLGLGTRTLEIPAGLFTVLRGAVVIDLPAEAVSALPELAEQEDER